MTTTIIHNSTPHLIHYDLLSPDDVGFDPLSNDNLVIEHVSPDIHHSDLPTIAEQLYAHFNK